jgi:hypothetical protein
MVGFMAAKIGVSSQDCLQRCCRARERSCPTLVCLDFTNWRGEYNLPNHPIGAFCEMDRRGNVTNEDWFMMRILQLASRNAVLALICCVARLAVAAGDGSAAQHRAAEEMLAALATGDAQAMALAIHQEELTLLRQRLLDAMKLEAERNDSLVRSRLFGSGMPLSEIERLTPQNFFVTLSQRLRFGARTFDDVEWLAAVDDAGGMVQMVGRSKPLKELGTVRVPVVVSIIPWGKDWKATVPLELQAQIEDLRAGRVRAPVASAAAPGAAGVAPTSELPAGMQELLRTAEENLRSARCEEYYEQQMSPNFRRTTAPKALRTLVMTCVNRVEWRERLLAAIALARNGKPRYEYAGTRAIFDLRDQGLPFAQFVVEQVDKRWYIAE